jgi:hypothetical protein
MKIKEVEERYLKGEIISCVFGRRKCFYQIENENITSKQYSFIVSKYKDNSNFKVDFSGLTKHFYTIKK